MSKICWISLQVINNYNKFLLICLMLLSLFPGKADAQYQVSGLVEFSYRDYETKIGGQQAISYHTFTQTYNANIFSPILDPRFLILQGFVGYSKSTTSGGVSGSSALTYGLNTSFFPGSKISGDLYGNKTITTVQGNTLLAGYDVNTTSYGGTLNLKLSRGTGLRDNNYNNGNNNNNGARSWSLPLPDISLFRNHSEMESLSNQYPLQEERDDTRATINYRLTNNVNLNLELMLQQYDNLQLKSSYDTKTANFDAQARISSDANLGLTARLTDRTTDNISGFSTNENTSTYIASLDFKEKDRIQQSYRSENTYQENQYATYTSNRADARITYRALANFSFFGQLNYNVDDYTPKSGTIGSVPYKQETGGLLFGALYVKEFRPDFLDPFILRASYDFNLGYSKVSSPVLPSGQGGGLYYINRVTAGLVSTGWKNEILSADASYSSKRDHSPTQNNVTDQRYALGFSTTRLPKTSIRASATYILQDSQVRIANVFVQQSNSVQQRRSLTYDLDASYIANTYLSFNAGTRRDHSTTNSVTLSTLALPSNYSYLQTFYYGAAVFNYMITRNLQYRAEVRDEYRIDDFLDTKTQTYRLNMNLDYRIRMILVGLEYHLQEDIPNNSLRIMQQQYLAKISRPF